MILSLPTVLKDVRSQAFINFKILEVYNGIAFCEESRRERQIEILCSGHSLFTTTGLSVAATKGLIVAQMLPFFKLRKSANFCSC